MKRRSVHVFELRQYSDLSRHIEEPQNGIYLYKPNRPLRSLGSSQLEIPRVHTKQGESAFSYYGTSFQKRSDVL